MKTTLTPPPITPGPWTVSPTTKYASRWVQDPKGWDVASVTQHQTGDYDAVAQFIAAAPAMAEALENCRQYLASLPESMHAESSAVYLGALSALLQAGYVAPTKEG